MKKRNIKEFILKYKIFIVGMLIWLIPLGFGSLMYLWWEPAEIIEEETVAEANPGIDVQDTLILDNPDKAAGYAAATLVRLAVPDVSQPWSGSAVVWDQTQEELIFVTSAHLLENVQGKLLVFFDREQYTEGTVLGVSEQADIGFVSCRKSQVPVKILENLRYVSLHQRIYDSLTAGDLCVAVGCSTEDVADRIQLLLFSAADQKMEGVGEGLFLLDGNCQAGMSGCGVFDGTGHFIGMVIAADGTRTLAVPMTRVNAAYTEITGNARDTREYEKG